MADPKTTTNFTDPGSNAVYTYISDTEIMLSAPRKEGTLITYFNFAAKDPSVRFVLDTGVVKQDLETVPMNQLPDTLVHYVGQAYMALRSLGGDPFTLTASVAAGPTGKKPKP